MNKNQIEAIVEEVQDRLSDLTTEQTLTPRATAEWEKLKLKFEKSVELEKEEIALEEKLDVLKDQRNDLKQEIRNQVNAFQKKHGVEVEWEYVDYEDGEEPEIKFPARDFKDKIRRQIAIMTIDKKGPLTADEIIETIINKFS